MTGDGGNHRGFHNVILSTGVPGVFCVHPPVSHRGIHMLAVGDVDERRAIPEGFSDWLVRRVLVGVRLYDHSW